MTVPEAYDSKMTNRWRKGKLYRLNVSRTHVDFAMRQQSMRDKKNNLLVEMCTPVSNSNFNLILFFF